jgi:hypothetical protein
VIEKIVDTATNKRVRKVPVRFKRNSTFFLKKRKKEKEKRKKKKEKK